MACLPFNAAIVPDYIWVTEADLRELSEANPDSSGQDPIAKIVNAARKYGVYGEESGDARIHVEFC
jgi:hypothetical protein